MRCVLNRFLAGACALAFVLFGLGSAKAADDFKGFYVGANAGGAFGHADAQTSTVFSSLGYFASTSVTAIAAAGHQKIEHNSLLAGGQLGYNHQWDNFVFGLEADFNHMDLSGTATSTTVYPCCAPTAFTITQTVADTNWLFTVRPRVGFVFGHVMFYETSGLALTKVKYSELFTDTFPSPPNIGAHESASQEEKRPGYTVGGGAEIRITHHFSVKGEYLYAGFGSVSVPSSNLTHTTVAPFAFPSNVFQHSVDLKAQFARGGINFRF
jgi:outer membrane immunogenic protein